MATAQTILFTIMPRGISLNGDTLPVSVFVAPRLYGADKLGAFEDWLFWTQRLKENGLTLVLRCGANSLDAPINTEPLRPELWAQLFHEDTLVRSHTFDDYTDRGIISYGVRETLSTLKAIYQEASVRLALPDRASRQGSDDRSNRGVLRDLVEGLDVHWNGDDAKRWREAVRRMNTSVRFAGMSQTVSAQLDGEGLLVRPRDPNASRTVAVPFAVFHHMPTPERKLGLDEQSNTLRRPDMDTLLDFHQALSSLNAYPDLLRALGIVFDLDLPRDFVTQTPLGQFGTFSVRRAGAGWDWAILPQTPELPTAYVHLQIGDQRLFLTAPRALADPSSPLTIIGLLSLDPTRFGLAQVDVDGAMHKAIILAETLHNSDPDRNLDRYAQPEPAPHPEVFDPEATLPALRSGGFSLFADRRSLHLLDNLQQSKTFNQAVEGGSAPLRPFFAEDLTRGYRLDVWDSRTNDWHSLHRRSGEYQIGDETFRTEAEEGFVQLALTQPAKGAEPATNDLYLHEAIARWAGWSLSVQRPGKHLSRYADPDKAVPPDGDDPDYREDQPDTPFKLTAQYQVIPGSLPRLRFGARYRLRARAMDLAGNSLPVGDPLANALSFALALPRDPEGFTYLRYEPVIAPLLILRDEKAVTEPGSAVDRIVIRTFNADLSQDALAADTTAADRHIVPPRTSVELGERLGMFDDASGNLKSDPATWQLIAERDAGEFNKATIEVAGKSDEYPLEAAARIDALPHLPDPLARGAAIRDLPGTPSAVIGKAVPNTGASGPIGYDALSDPNPRPGSVTLIRFNDGDDWQQTTGFRLTLAEPTPAQTDLRPNWDAVNRLLTVYLPKGQTTVVPLSSYLSVDDLKLMGVWQWLCEYIERITITNAQPQYLRPGSDMDEIAHILQRAVEGGHWMLTPPRLLTLVHAVQQPIGRPAFSAIRLEHEVVTWDQNPLQTAPLRGRTDPSELAPISA
ncbi:MAG: hypothetical protein LC737_06035, partial [Chloroflexi bacterium]|nr:hypothetical protein [Chloroflexota bacterium]